MTVRISGSQPETCTAPMVAKLMHNFSIPQLHSHLTVYLHLAQHLQINHNETNAEQVFGGYDITIVSGGKKLHCWKDSY